MRKSLEMAAIVLALVACLVPAPALADETIDGFMDFSVSASTSEGFGFSEMGPLMKLGGETRGRFKLFASLANSTDVKEAYGSVTQTSFKLGLKYMLNEHWFVGLGGHQAQLNYKSAGGDRTDTSYFATFGRTGRSTIFNFFYRLPDDSRYETHSFGFEGKQYLKMNRSERLRFGVAVSYDHAISKLQDESIQGGIANIGFLVALRNKPKN